MEKAIGIMLALTPNPSLDTEKQLQAAAPPRGLFSGQLQR